jgi:hypothetical protein
MRAKEGLGCSQFETEAFTRLVKEVYFPWLSQPEAIQGGQLAMTAVSADEPGHKPLTLLLLGIIQWKPLQVNHQYDAQLENQKREALTTSRSASGQVCNYRSADGSTGMPSAPRARSG